jgi:7-carboxy-7-deazaguanine synthase
MIEFRAANRRAAAPLKARGRETTIRAMRITEIFYSIQGEGTRAGLPCVFVRLAACNLRCVWCDTTYAFDGGTEMSVEEVVREVARYACRSVEITGGEPLLQKEVHPLLSRLADAGYTVLLETSGSLDVSEVDPRVIRIMDIKCPGSGESARNRWENLGLLSPKDEIKFVIRDRADFDWACTVVRERDLAAKHPVLLSPVHGELDPALLSRWILESGLDVRLQIQLHKYLGVP